VFRRIDAVVSRLPFEWVEEGFLSEWGDWRQSDDDDGDDTATVNFQVTESFLEQIDDTWQERGFNSRSEFIQYTLQDAVDFPMFDRAELVALLEAEEDIREGRTKNAEEARELFGTSGERY
jgi:Arc/MetJ-type ribon-helix-helix transcriptional regulator